MCQQRGNLSGYGNFSVWLFVLILVFAARGLSHHGAMPRSENKALEETPVERNCTAPISACVGDCNQDAEVSIDEIVTGVAIALGLSPLPTCTHMDRDGQGDVTIDEIIAAVRAALEGCPLDRGAIYEVRACDDERFRILLVDPQATQLAERILAGEEPQKIVIGDLRCGSGNFNGPWNWHLEPATVGFADVTIELCDGCPSFVETELEYWLDTVRRYCPWSAELLRRVR